MATRAQIDLNALALYAMDIWDMSPDFEDDSWAQTLGETRVYVERKRDHFRIEIGRAVHQLPRP